MSELKTYDVLMTPSDDGAWVLKSAADKVIANQKYKRCLAMAEWCDAEADVADADGDYNAMRWYQKWHTRWLNLAKIVNQKYKRCLVMAEWCDDEGSHR